MNDLELSRQAPQVSTKPFKARWTIKRLMQWIKDEWGKTCSDEPLRKVLHDLGFSWKKYRKLLNKADPLERQQYLDKLRPLLEKATLQQRLVVYIDEAHIHLDAHEGYGWSIKGERAWISSSSPGLKKLSFYGVYLYNLGQVRLYPYLTADGDRTIDVLKKIKQEFPHRDITLIWDGASYHRKQDVLKTAKDLAIDLEPLPAYSPDFMPVEHLWRWFREDITYQTAYHDELELVKQAELFQQAINADPLNVADRLWVKATLNPDEEKLRFSK